MIDYAYIIYTGLVIVKHNQS